MFQVDRHGIDHRIREAESNYIIRPNDELTLEVHTNRGEKLIDPNRQSFTDAGTGVRATTPVKYVVDLNGTVDLPLIGRIALKDLTLQQAEELLAEAYEAFYEEPFIVLTFTNKRVSVLGATGGRVVPLQYEHAPVRSPRPGGKHYRRRTHRQHPRLAWRANFYCRFQQRKQVP